MADPAFKFSQFEDGAQFWKDARAAVLRMLADRKGGIPSMVKYAWWLFTNRDKVRSQPRKGYQ